MILLYYKDILRFIRFWGDALMLSFFFSKLSMWSDDSIKNRIQELGSDSRNGLKVKLKIS